MLAGLIFAVAATLAAERAVEITAHRGESADAPENTLAAFKLAWERKVAAIELDVHLTKDGKLVVIHDADTKRTTGVMNLVKDCTWDELRKLDAGLWKARQFAGEPLPLLENALATIPQAGRCLIEVKVGPEAVPALEKAVQACGKTPAQLAVISFNAATLAEAKRRLPNLKMYYLSGFKKDKATGEWTPRIEELIAKAREIKADGLDLGWDGPWDEAFVRQVREAKLELYVWTVDDEAVARRMVKLGVDGITTNKADWLRDALLKSPE